MSPQEVSQELKDYIRSNIILVSALIIGVLIFSIIILALNFIQGPVLTGEDAAHNHIFRYAVLIMGAICFTLALYIYKKELPAIKNTSLLLKEKLNNYRALLIKYMAICEGGALFSIIVVFLTGEMNLFGVTIILIATMWIKMPTKKKVIEELSLDWNEQQEL